MLKYNSLVVLTLWTKCLWNTFCHLGRMSVYCVGWVWNIFFRTPRGHLQTMWTVFWGFLTLPPPLWTNMDILGTPLSVHVDFSMTPLHFILKKFTVGIYWNFEIQIYYKIFVEYLVPNTFMLYSSNSSSTCKFPISNVKMWES